MVRGQAGIEEREKHVISGRKVIKAIGNAKELNQERAWYTWEAAAWPVDEVRLTRRMRTSERKLTLNRI